MLSALTRTVLIRIPARPCSRVAKVAKAERVVTAALAVKALRAMAEPVARAQPVRVRLAMVVLAPEAWEPKAARLTVVKDQKVPEAPPERVTLAKARLARAKATKVKGMTQVQTQTRLLAR